MPGTGVLSEVKARQIPRRIMVNREDAEREMAITQSGEVRFLTVAQRSSANNILDFRVNISLAFLISPAIRSLLELTSFPPRAIQKAFIVPHFQVVLCFPVGAA